MKHPLARVRLEHAWLTALAVAILGLAMPAGPTAQDDPSVRPLLAVQPNVLVVVVDDMGVDKVGAYAADADPDYADDADYLPDTPRLDAIAAAGARFTDAWSNPSCSPTRAALLTGRHGFRTGVGMPIGLPSAPTLDLSETTLAEAVGNVGYATGIFGKWHLGTNEPPADWADDDTWEDHLGESYEHAIHPISHGFDAFVGTIDGSLEKSGGGNSYYDWIAVSGDYCEDCDVPYTAVAEARTDYATDATITDTLAWIDDQEGPWLAVVALHATHIPLELPPEGCSYRDSGADAPTTDIGIYEEMVECMDRRVGQLLDGIDDLGRTLVIVTSDNGTDIDFAEGVFADGGGKGSVREGGVRVPLMIADGKWLERQRDNWLWNPIWSALPTRVSSPGLELSTPVHLVDIFATVAGVAGADATSADDSVSLLPLLAGSVSSVHDSVYAEQFSATMQGQVGLRVDDWKLVVRVAGAGSARCRASRYLYDLSVDRFEVTDLADDEPEVLAAMLEELERVASGAWSDVPDC